MALFPCGKGVGAGFAHGHARRRRSVHLLAGADGMPLPACSAPADEDERKHAGRLIETAAVKNVRRLAADKGYDADALRNFLKKKGIQPDPTKKERREKTGAADARQRATISSRTDLLMAAKKVPVPGHPAGKTARLFPCVSLLGSLFHLGSTISGIGSWSLRTLPVFLPPPALQVLRRMR